LPGDSFQLPENVRQTTRTSERDPHPIGLANTRGACRKTTSKLWICKRIHVNVPKQPANARKNQSRSSPHKPPTPPHAVNLSQSTTQDRRTPPAYPFLSDLHVKEQNHATPSPFRGRLPKA
jgi:hypothetical protein